LMHPTLLAGLVVIDIAPTRYDAKAFHGPELAMLAAFDPAELTSRLEADSRLKEWIEDAPIRAFLVKNIRARDGGGFQWRFDAEAIRTQGYLDIADWPDTLSSASGLSWRGSAVFIRGALSLYVDPERDGREISLLFPNAHLISVENARHWVHVDNKNGFLQLLRNFLYKL